MLKTETNKGYYDGAYKAILFIGGRALPAQVVRQQRPDGTWKFRICRDGGWLKDGDSPNYCIDMEQQPTLILVRIQDIAYAGAIMRSSGSLVWFLGDRSSRSLSPADKGPVRYSQAGLLVVQQKKR